MPRMSPIEPFDDPIADAPAADDPVADYRRQAREFMTKSRRYLAEGDLRQASEKGWGAAAWMAKAVAEAQGWQYTRHDQFADVINRARLLSGDARLRNFRRAANELHGYFYTRKRFLDADDISDGLERISELLGVLETLTATD